MKEYKRLTKKEEDWFDTNLHSAEVYNRLVELEYKIENGTLIELPCKVGDTIYHLSDKKISKETVKQIKYIIDNGEIDLLNSYIMTDDIYSKDYNFYRFSKFGKSIFLTKAEAEYKKCKEEIGKAVLNNDWHRADAIMFILEQISIEFDRIIESIEK